MATREDIESFLRSTEQSVAVKENPPGQLNEPLFIEQSPEASVSAIPIGPTTGDKILNSFNNLAKAGIEIPLGIVEASANMGEAISRASHKTFGTRDIPQEAYETRQFIDTVRGWAEKTLPTHPELVNDFWTTDLPGMFGSAGGFLFSGGALRKALQIGSKKAVSAGGVVAKLGATVGFNEFYEDAKAHGADVGDSFTSGLIGAGVGTTEALPMGKWLGRVMDKVPVQSKNNILRALGRIGKEGFEEALQEGFQGLAQNVTAQQIGYDPERNTIEGVPEGAGGGAIVGVTLSALSHAFGGRRLSRAVKGTEEKLTEPSPEETERTTDETELRQREEPRSDIQEGQHLEGGGESQDNAELRTEVEQTAPSEDAGKRERKPTVTQALDAVKPPTLSQRIGTVPESRRVKADRTLELIEQSETTREITSGVEVGDPSATVDLPPTPGSALVVAINPETGESFPLRFDGYLDQRKFVGEKELEAAAARGVSPIEESLTSGKPIPSLTQEGVFVADAGTEGIKIADLEGHGYRVEGVPTFGASEGARQAGVPLNRFSGVSASSVASDAYQAVKSDPGALENTKTGIPGEAPPVEPPPPLIAAASGGHPNVRKPTKAYSILRKSPSFREAYPEVVEELDKGTYTTTSLPVVKSMGEAVVDSFNGDLQAAFNTFSTTDNGYFDGLNEHVRHYAIAETAKRLRIQEKNTTDPLEARDLLDQQQQLWSLGQQKASKEGQDLRLTALIQQEMSPLFWVERMMSEISRGKRELISEETTNRIRGAYDAASDATEVKADDVKKKTKENKGKSRKGKKDKPERSLADQYRDASVKSLERIFFGKSQDRARLEKLFKRLVNEVSSEVKKPNQPDKTLGQIVGEWILNPEQVETVIERFDTLIDERLEDETLTPDEADAARKTIQEARRLAFKKAGKKSLETILKTTKIDFNEIVKTARREQGEFLTAVTEYLINETELSEVSSEDISRLAEAVVETFEEKRAEILRRVLDQMKGLPAKSSRSKTKQKTVIEKLDRLARLGDLRTPEIQDTLAEVFHELVPLSPENRSKLMDMVEQMQEAPDGMPKNRLHQKAIDFIQQNSSVTYGEFIAAFWYQSVLSGLGTQAVNVSSTAINVSLELASLAIGTMDARAVSKILNGAMAGFSAGMREFGPIMRGDFTGRIRSEVTRASSPLELVKADKSSHWILRLFANSTYVSRFMSAMDTLNGHVGTRARLALSSYLRAKGTVPEGSLQKIEAEMDRLMGTSKKQYQAAKSQAEGEARDGIIDQGDVERRTAELQNQMVPVELMEDASKFGVYTTFNSLPTGFLGSVSKAILQARQKHPLLLTPLFPFVTIPFNVTNSMLNYTPWAFARMWFQKTGQEPGGVFEGAQEMSEADYNALKAKAIISTTLWTSLLNAAWHYLTDEDEKDDPLFVINGGWFGLSRTETGQLMSAGQRRWSIKIGRGSDAVSISYKDTPLGLFLGTVGIASDMKRFQDMDNHSIMGNTAAMLAQGFGFITDLNAMANISDLSEAISVGDRDMMVQKGNQLFTRPITGFIPNIAKEMESWVDPRIFKAANTADYILKDIPVVRSHSGLMPLINVLGEEIEVRRTPWRRFVASQEQDPVWDAIAKRANSNLFIPVARKFIIRKPGGVEERIDDKTFWRYQKAVGTRYREWLERNIGYFNSASHKTVEEDIYRGVFAKIREQERAKIRRNQ